MITRSTQLAACLLLWVTTVCWPQASPKSTKAQAAAADSFQKKLDHLRSNGLQAHPDQAPTVFTEDELNAYFAARRVMLPAGLKSVQFVLTPGALQSALKVDFDQLTANARSSNPLLSIFSGVHDVVVKAHGEGSGGVARAHVDSVALDGSELPRFLLELFVDKFLKPKYPNASLDPTFKLPEKIDLLTLGEHKATVTQK
jgi:hypothetical protein